MSNDQQGEYAIGTLVRDPGTGIRYTYVGEGMFKIEGGDDQDLYSLAGVAEEVIGR